MPVRPFPTAAFLLPSQIVQPEDLLDARPFVMRHEWSQPFRTSTTYSTDQALSIYQGVQQNTARWVRPVRTVDVALSTVSDDVDFVRQYLARTLPRTASPNISSQFLTAGLNSSYQATLDSDMVCIEGFGTSGELQGDFEFKRYYEGARFAVFKQSRGQFNIGNQRVPALVGTIDSLAGNELSAILPQEVQVGDIVVPLLDCQPATGTSLSYDTGLIGRARLTSTELRGPSALPASVFRGVFPDNLPTYTGRDGVTRPLLVVDHNYRSQMVMDLSRDLEQAEAGIRLIGRQPRRGFNVVAAAWGHRTAYDTRQLFDYAQGRAGAFWIVAPEIISNDLTVNAVDRSQVKFKPMGNHLEWASLNTAFYLPQTDSIHEFLVQPNNNWDATVTPPIPGGERRFSCVKLASIGSFFSDSMQEEWESAGVGEISFTLVERTTPNTIELQLP